MNRKLSKETADDLIRFRVPAKLKAEFMESCKNNGKVAADILRAAVEYYLKTNRNVKEEE